MTDLQAEPADTLREALGDACMELYAIKSLAWAARNLLLHNCDQTILPVELDARVAELAEVIEAKADSLSEALDRIAYANQGGPRHG